ncbi:MAG: c-type cytochrome [Fidelibacterota bacterium]
MRKLVFTGLLVVMGCASLIPLKVGPPRDITVDVTPERIARGEYLANHVTHCITCHSELNWDFYAGGQPQPGTEGQGGDPIAENMGIIGSFEVFAGNITPAALNDWTDGQVIQAITEGVTRDGRPLFPVMPYSAFRIMPEEDVYAIVAYLRQLKPIENPVGKKKIKRILKLVERTFPSPWDPQPLPDPSDRLAYGKYLATIGSCHGCHDTFSSSGKPIEGMTLAGGNEFALPEGGTVRSSNITSDPETGIGNRSREEFIGLFKSFQNPVKMDEMNRHQNTVMPWPAFAGMKDEDLGAIYDYLMWAEPVKNRVEKYPVLAVP